MATFSVVVSDPRTGRSYTREVEGQTANRFMGREIGDEVDGGPIGLDGFTLEITGGSDDAGRPMRGDVRGPDLKEILLEGGTGYKPTRDGERKRVTVRGREVSDAVAQLNVRVVDGPEAAGVALDEVEADELDVEIEGAAEPITEEDEAEEAVEEEAEEAVEEEAEEAVEEEAEDDETTEEDEDTAQDDEDTAEEDADTAEDDEE